MVDRDRDRDFEGATRSVIEVPTAGACAVYPRISSARAEQECLLVKRQRAVDQVQYRHQDIVKRWGAASSQAGWDTLEDAATFLRVLACDTLPLRFPLRMRTKPVGEYDRILGIGEFYTVLTVLSDAMDPVATQWPLPFQLTETVEILKRVRRLRAFVEEPENAGLRGGKLDAGLDRLSGFVTRSDALVSARLDRLGRCSGREALIGGGIAFALAADPGTLTFHGKRRADWLVAELRDNCRRPHAW